MGGVMKYAAPFGRRVFHNLLPLLLEIKFLDE